MSKRKRKGRGGVPRKVAAIRHHRLDDGRVLIEDGPGALTEMPTDGTEEMISVPVTADGVAINVDPDDLHSVVSDAPHGDTEAVPVLALPTGLLKQLLEAGRRADLVLQVSEDDADALDPAGTHQFGRLVRFAGGDQDFVRGHLRVLRKGRDSLHPWSAWVDVPTRYIGMVFAASEHRRAPEAAPAPARHGQVPFPRQRPTWAGSFSFARAWDSAAEKLSGVTAVNVGERGWYLDPMDYYRMASILFLDTAHLVRIEPEQVAVLPDWDDLSDAWDFAADAGLPFEHVYLDFEGPGGFAPLVSMFPNVYERDEGTWRARQTDGEKVTVHLHGAAVDRDGNGNLHVTPFGGFSYGGEDQSMYVRPLGTVAFDAPLLDQVVSSTEQSVVGLDGHRYFTEALSASTEFLLASGGTPGRLGCVTVPFPRDDPETPSALTVMDAVLTAALRVLAALSIMESEAVVVEDAPLEKRDRDRAEKRGWKIAQMVYVRPTRKGPRSEPTGESAHYSHRFWVSGHYKHHPIGSRLADMRPDLVRPCTRVGPASCGSCRRVWTGPFIKGPEDKPLVVKSLVKRR